MEERSRNRLIFAAAAAVCALAVVGAFFWFKPNPANVAPLRDTAAVGLGTAPEYYDGLTTVLRMAGVRYTVVDGTTIAVRRDELADIERILARQDLYTITYQLSPTSVEQPLPSGKDLSTATVPTRAELDAQEQAAESPSPSPTASAQASGSPSQGPSAVPSSAPPTPTASPSVLEPVDGGSTDGTYALPGGESLNTLVGKDGSLTHKGPWSEDSTPLGAVTPVMPYSARDAASGKRIREWIDRSILSGSRDAEFFTPLPDGRTWVTYVKAPQDAVDSMIAYVGPENLTVGREDLLTFTVSPYMALSRAKELASTLPLPMQVIEVTAGQGMLRYSGPIPSQTEMTRLGNLLRKAYGDNPVALASG